MLEIIDNTLWTSDSHLGHANIIRYCDRPFKNVSHMDELMIRSWNEQVAQDQWVIHLGDFSFEPGKYLSRLNGKIILVMGNHDNNRNINLFFNVVHHISVKIGEFNCYLTHRPLVLEEKRSKDPEPNLAMLDCHDFIICGHVHEKWKVNGKNINIGVDAWGGNMLSSNQLIQFLDKVNKENITFMESDRWNRKGT